MIRQQPDIKTRFSRVQAAFAMPLQKLSEISEKISLRALAVAATAAACLVVAAELTFSVNFVNVTIDGTTKKVVTFSNSATAILGECGIHPTADDFYSFSGIQNSRARIHFLKAFKVGISTDGSSRQIKIARGTVADALKKAGVTLGSDDLINAKTDSKVYPGESIVINRVTYDTVGKSKVLPYNVVTKTTSLMSKGTKVVLVPGQNGQSTVSTKAKSIDGKVVERNIITETVDKNPVNEVLLVGTAARTPVSKFEAPGLSLSSSGTPQSFSRLIHGVATAYWAPTGSSTSTGRGAGVGNVAVDPSRIPYGSRLYIMSPDGSFVYGSAIAADTGGFVSNGSGVTVDLFMPSESSCSSFGVRNVCIYVLD